jgi:hypothetical protein
LRWTRFFVSVWAIVSGEDLKWAYMLINKVLVIELIKLLNYHPIPWRDSISRPITPVSSVAGGDDPTRPHQLFWCYICNTRFYSIIVRCMYKSLQLEGIGIYGKHLSENLSVEK